MPRRLFAVAIVAAIAICSPLQTCALPNLPGRVPFGGGRKGKAPKSPPPPPPAVRRTGLAGKFDNYIDKLFDDADTNRDGSICTSETYELVLKMYVHINRKAPIPPPTREKVEELFKGADADRSGRLNREEFRRLALVLASRASARVVAHKVVTIVCAPLLAVEVVRVLVGRDWVQQVADKIFPEHITGQKVAGLVRKAEFWRTALTVGFVVTLGNLMLTTVNVLMDMKKKKNDDDEKKK